MPWHNADPFTNEAQIAGVPSHSSWTPTHLGIHNYRGNLGDGSQLGAQTNADGVNSGPPLLGGAVPDGEWHHSATTYDGTDLKLYIDGVLANTRNFPGTTLYSETPHLTVGARNAQDPGNYYKGRIDEVKLFNTALSEAEIQAAMVPEPSGVAILLAGLAGLALAWHRRGNL